LTKIFFRWGIFVATFNNHGDNQDWKVRNKTYYENSEVVTSYGKTIHKKYVLEHKLFTLDKWLETLLRCGKKRVLDFGCGPGYASIKLLENGIQAFSVDVSRNMLSHLQDEAEGKGLKCSCVAADAEHLPFKPGTFDGLICLGVLHHLPDIRQGVNNQLRVLNRGGLLFIAEPFKEKPWFSYPYYFLVSAAKFFLNIFKQNSLSPRERLISRQELASITAVLKENNFQYNLSYIVYWPVICGYLPEAIALPLVRFLNRINRRPERADTIIICAQKPQ
jgi:SAM-dependent methyltransferase